MLEINMRSLVKHKGIKHIFKKVQEQLIIAITN